MCKGELEGGQRCASHTRKALDSALIAEEAAITRASAAERHWKRHGGDQDDWHAMNEAAIAVNEAAQNRWKRHVDFASTPTGRKEIEDLRKKASDSPLGPGRFGASYYERVLREGDKVRAVNQDVKAAVKAAQATKAAKEPQPTRPDGVMVTADDLNYGDKFIDPDSGDVVELHRLFHANSDGSDEVETTAGWTVTIKAGQKVERVPDTVETTGQDFEDYKAEVNADQHPNAISEDDFDARYGPHGDGEMLDDPPTDTDPKHVWTIVEGDLDYQYAVPGVHKVNALGYITTEQPWATGNEEAIWVDGSEYSD
jgi:hypothetical protein